MLLSDGATVSGGDSLEAGFVVLALSGALAVVGVVGRPAPDAIARAVADVTDMTPVIAQPGNAPHVGQALRSRSASTTARPLTPERAVMHRLPAPTRQGPSSDILIRLLGPGDRLAHLPPGLRFEIRHARETVPVTVAVADGLPASFCYPCWLTETLWDVSIDTLASHRRRGLAACAARFMIDHMRENGREPVWGAVESNGASLGLARAIGFVSVDEIVVFSRGPWAYLSRGFEEIGTETEAESER